MQERVCSLIRMKPPVHESNGLLFASDDTVPTDATVGYQTGCIFQHTDGGDGDALYVNEEASPGGASADFNLIVVT